MALRGRLIALYLIEMKKPDEINQNQMTIRKIRYLTTPFLAIIA